jgi:hypothetical protein
LNTVEFFKLIIAIVSAIYLCKKQKKDEYNKKVKRMADRDISYAQYGNNKLLKSYGEEKFIGLYGKEQYELVRKGNDTKIVELKKDWEDYFK